MNNKKIIQEDIKRIQSIMGISTPLLNEQVNLIPKPLIKKILGSAEDIADPLTKVFNLSDNQIDNVLRQIDEVGVDNLSDDVLELLSKSSIDNVDDLVKFMKVGKFFGSNFDEIALTIFNKVDTLPTIDTTVRNKAVGYYTEKLDNLPFLDGADEIKKKLVRDFKTTFDERYVDDFIKIATQGVDELFSGLDDVSENISNMENLSSQSRAELKRYWDTFWLKKESVYDMIRRRSKLLPQNVEGGGSIRLMKDIEIEKFLKTNFSAFREASDKATKAAIDSAISTNWFKALTWKQKTLLLVILITEGKPINTLMNLATLLAVGSEELDNAVESEVNDFLDNRSGVVTKLTNTNIKEHLIQNYTLDEPSFDDEYKIYINQDGKSARVRGPRNYTITLTDGKISSN